ncbi:arsenate reductase ArsC [Nitratidesulfovibrio termitidis]|uniref:arsenate reductase ArsC n=1 Tax=Nitratidesulfovibrio termitidis TaxID=42252 RepID=UPI000416630E|nr:arsenate reductase ArsC [Nitratidesulfovibrio termitidis]
MHAVRVLFLCVHNSARSQMAEAFLRKHGGEAFLAESAGLEPGPLNPLAVQAMQEVGIDISNATARSVFELFRQGRMYDHVVTVCAEGESQCPLFPGAVRRHHWPFDDPAALVGDEEQRMKAARIIRDAIEARVKEFVASLPPTPHSQA